MFVKRKIMPLTEDLRVLGVDMGELLEKQSVAPKKKKVGKSFKKKSEPDYEMMAKSGGVGYRQGADPEVYEQLLEEKASAVKEKLMADQVSLSKDGEFTARWEYFYRHGATAEKYAEKVRKAYPEATIKDKGDHFAPFRGSASTKASSHFWVKFTIPGNPAKITESAASIRERKAGPSSVPDWLGKDKAPAAPAPAKNQPQYKYGFDLTDFKPGGFQKVLAGMGISAEGNRTDEGFIWKGDGIKIVTANNPITGEYHSAGRRKEDKDYASYMGLEGDKNKVMKAVRLIKSHADMIKDESAGVRDYI